jgi:hypothetical protein
MARLADCNPLLRAFVDAVFTLDLMNVNRFIMAAVLAGVDPPQMAAVKELFCDNNRASASAGFRVRMTAS